MVILRPEKTFARHWPLGKILEVYPGQDKRVRVALVKTASGNYKRPVVKMSLLFRPGEEQGRTQETDASSPPSMFRQDPPMETRARTRARLQEQGNAP